MTCSPLTHYASIIIPYQELLGNYDHLPGQFQRVDIIPYQELLGNYDLTPEMDEELSIIPYQELLGNYDCQSACAGQ